ncbi:saccharopine dehydrogenase [Streptomyces sp. NPDC048291]|uniref:saccharopine dehydrogenase n=1 Tax=Streptomyces sp. NPDC048291 TaxID=3365530 RepID=UPI003711A3F9
MMTLKLWLRSEERPTERRAAIVPDDARSLVARGIGMTVERSPHRVFPLAEYAAAGCRIVPRGSWSEARPEDVIVGLKGVPSQPWALRNRHVVFAHAYKGQPGGRELLSRFTAGGGALLDMECLVDDDGRRVAAFGYWAGYVGAALAVLHARRVLPALVEPLSHGELQTRLRSSRRGRDRRETAVVVGARGRCGRGACEALETAGIAPARWGRQETARLDREALLGHDILINAIGAEHAVPALLTEQDLDHPARRLSVVGDVTCDVGAPTHALPVYTEPSTWDRPVQRLYGRGRPLDVIGLDNLCSLIPVEASRDFSRALCAHLPSLPDGSPLWQRAQEHFLRLSATSDQPH